MLKKAWNVLFKNVPPDVAIRVIGLTAFGIYVLVDQLYCH